MPIFSRLSKAFSLPAHIVTDASKFTKALNAAKESITEDKDASGREVAGKLLHYLNGPEGQHGLNYPGTEEFPAQAPLGVGVDIAADPINLVGGGAAKEGSKLFPRLVRAIR